MSRYPYGLSPDITPTSSPSKLTKAQKSRARREPSGVFSLFSPPQIQQFREAFALIDHDGDGIVSEQDLKHIFSSLGISPSRSTLDQLLADRPGDRRGSLGGIHSRIASAESADGGGGGTDRGITFPMFLTMMGEHLYDFDAEAELLAAFECFDESDSGFVKCDEIRKWLGDVGERMDEHEIDKFLKGPFTRNGQFNYREWVKVLRINTDNEETDSQ
ncbi:EF-hand protein [Cubamyces lactineus]|nr:EF-hand protein [Cubamyces lactineus]